MKHLHVPLLLLALSQNLCAQLSDNVWLGGYDEYPGVPDYGQFELRFKESGVQVQQVALAFNFESCAAVATKPDGDLLFYSNGCEVANRDHEVMPNGYGLSPGDISDMVCPWKGHIVPQGAMVLPWPGDSLRYVLLHMGADYEPKRKLRLGPLFYSVVDMSLQGGLGDVASKNNVLLEGDFGHFTAVRHGNGRDWWLLVPAFGGTKWHTFLLAPNGITEMPLQTIGLGGGKCEHHGQTAASMEGSAIAHWGDCKVTVLGFDRCGGLLSERHQLAAPAHWFAGGGAIFSPSGRYLYATSHNVLFRADLEAASPKLDTMRFSYGQCPLTVPGNTFHWLVNGPDGGLYGNIPSRASFFHALKSPEAAGAQSINFEPQDIKLPVTNARTLPHFPNYRLYDLPDSPCDTLGINTPVATAEPTVAPKNERLVLFPNPASDQLHIALPESWSGPLQVMVSNTAGQMMHAENMKATGKSVSLQLGPLPAGLYVCKVMTEGRLPLAEVFVVMR